MTVHRILSGKPQNLHTVTGKSTVAEAVDRLAQANVGALIVSDDGVRLDGILSERDVIRRLSKFGAGILDKPVSSLMTTTVVTCSPANSVVEVMQAMTNGRFRHMPVVENGVLKGVVSIGDVVKYRMDEVEHEADQMRQFITGG